MPGYKSVFKPANACAFGPVAQLCAWEKSKIGTLLYVRMQMVGFKQYRVADGNCFCLHVLAAVNYLIKVGRVLAGYFSRSGCIFSWRGWAFSWAFSWTIRWNGCV